MEHKFW